MTKYLFSLFFLLLYQGQVMADNTAACVADTCEITAPTIWAERDSTCSGQPVLLWAAGCTGTVQWSNGLAGDTIVSRPATTRTYTAICKKGNCQSPASGAVTVVVPIPDIPVLNVSQRTVCAGGSAVLTASGCPGVVVWSNGSMGREITVRPAQTTNYTAICLTGSQQADGLKCISCFAEPIEVKVADSVRPVLIASQKSICANDPLSLRVVGCPGLVQWSDAADLTASSRVVEPAATTAYTAICKVGDCDFTTNHISVRVGPAPIPVIVAERSVVCAGEKVKVTASGCDGTVTWSNGQTGSEIMLLPEASPTIKARCGQGDCRSDFSSEIIFTINPTPPKPLVQDRKNECPYVTLDLMVVLPQKPSTEGGRYEFRAAAAAGSAEVAQPSFAGAGTYYVFEKSAAGCYSDAAAVTITINECLISVSYPVTPPSVPGVSGVSGVVTTPVPPKDSTSVNNRNPPSVLPPTSSLTEVFVPEGFSPNGDGINDRFVLGNVPDEMNVSFEVYNRWGQLVHQENDYKSDWDGKANRSATGGGKNKLADGTYFYVIRLSDGREFIKFLTITH